MGGGMSVGGGGIEEQESKLNELDQQQYLEKVQDITKYLSLSLYSILNERLLNHFETFEFQFGTNDNGNPIVQEINSFDLFNFKIDNNYMNKFTKQVLDHQIYLQQQKNQDTFQFENLQKIIDSQQLNDFEFKTNNFLVNDNFNKQQFLNQIFKDHKFKACLNSEHFKNQSFLTYLNENKLNKWEIRKFTHNYVQNLQYCDLVIDQKPNLHGVSKRNNFDWNNQYNNYSENCQKIHRKDTFYQLMENYDKKQKQFQNYGIKNFLPKTYKLEFFKNESMKGIQQFLDLQENSDNSHKWIYKPAFSSEGIGIVVFNNLKEAQNYVKQIHEDFVKNGKKNSTKSVIQQYIDKTALYENRKFDIRCYLLISSFDVKSELVFYNQGVVRTSKSDYEIDEEINQENMNKHLTNCAIQLHLDEDYDIETIIKFFRDVQQHSIDKYGFTQQQADHIKTQIKQVLTYVAEAYLDSIPAKNRKQGQFQHFGVDIMLDDQFRPYLLEVNSGPKMVVGTTTFDSVAKEFLKSMMDIQTYLIENQDQRKNIIKEQTYPMQDNLELLINRANGFNFLTEQLKQEPIKQEINKSNIRTEDL